MFNGKKNAFTLVELLVTIAIIGILSTIVIISVSNARAKARNTKRISDLRSVRTGLDVYLSSNAVIWVDGNDATSDLAVAGILPVIPKDPDTSKGYVYCASGTSYLLQSVVESGSAKPLGSSVNTISGTSKCSAAAGGSVVTDCSLAGTLCITNLPAGQTSF
ncbi:MAG: type II secretion system protein [Candidatus Komeilibacteria bacterium]|nr:type II secretion system protein [Candidatus Komeilibacteria bacterium]